MLRSFFVFVSEFIYIHGKGVATKIIKKDARNKSRASPL